MTMMAGPPHKLEVWVLKRGDVGIERLDRFWIFLPSKVTVGYMQKLYLSDEQLLIAHKDALTLKLDKDFIHLLEIEIKRRDLMLTVDSTIHMENLAEMSR
ncbi:sporulation histidine kinase inhibitor Sda [Domibacillus aminovorans]|uniref:sporulation histidine kinase inhibitor Sda n=1 Tax=Domibacillus aminovorans TaxID=29332 RepID=UPI001E3E736E|nr:sporulation histidine kinase inhibitor Sda [Domibacillus aminovorans]